MSEKENEDSSVPKEDLPDVPEMALLDALARKILKVPKSVVDERLEAEKRQREPRPRKHVE